MRVLMEDVAKAKLIFLIMALLSLGWIVLLISALIHHSYWAWIVPYVGITLFVTGLLTILSASMKDEE
jgi:hypothetical protein